MSLSLNTDSTDCEACKRLRKGTTWINEPPKCPKHRDNNVSFTGGWQ